MSQSSVQLNDITIRRLVTACGSREKLWIDFIRKSGAKNLAEIGVYKGIFAALILSECKEIKKYYMIDPWRHLSDWNKPLNTDGKTFASVFSAMKVNTNSFAKKLCILRGRTTEVIQKIPDCSLDFAYIDGDHTLRGITVDLLRVYPKIRPGGYLAGDDFTASIWQHSPQFEPTLVFPLAVHFSEGVGARIIGLPYNQFLIQKPSSLKSKFEFIDLTCNYKETELRGQISPRFDLRQIPPNGS